MSGLDLMGLGDGLGGLSVGQGVGGLNYMPGNLDLMPGGNDIASFYVIEPPDDRYIAGYSSTQVDGDSKTVGPRLKDLNIPFSLYGLPIPITFGVRKLYSNIIWAVPLRENIKKKSATGKGGAAVGVSSSTTEYQYYATYAVAFGYPGLPDVGGRKVLKVWADGTLIYDRRGTGQQKMNGFNFRFYDGSETQMPDPIMEEREGEGNVPAYRGLMYMVIDDLPVKGWGDRPPAISVEIGDDVVGTYTITNVLADQYLPSTGTQEMDAILFDKDLNYVYAITTDEVNDWPIRTFDMSSATRVNTAPSNTSGAGWVGNSGAQNPGTLANRQGLLYSSSQSWTYIPWLRQIVGQTDYSATGSAPVIIMDPVTGIVTNWIGCTDEGPGAEYPGMSELIRVVQDLPKRYFNGTIPHLEQLCPQQVYGLYGADTYILGRTVYGDTVMLWLNTLTGVLDINWIGLEATTDYSIVAPGGIYAGHSDFYAVRANFLYRIRVQAGANNHAHLFGTEVGTTVSLVKTCPANINNIFYYAAEDAIVVLLTDGIVKKYDAATLVEIFSVGPVSIPGAALENFWLNNADAGSLCWAAGSNIHELDLAFGTVATYSDGGSNYIVQSGRIVESLYKTMIGVGAAGSGSAGTGQTQSMDNAISRYFFDRVTDVRIPLSDFIMGMCILAGYEAADIVISADIDDMIDGAIIASGTTFRRVMDVVCLLYRIDMIESDGKIKFTRKAVGYEGTDFAIPQGDTLLPDPSDPTSPTFQFRREEEVVMPRRVNVQYIDKGLGYQWSMMTATRAFETNNSTNDITYQIPIVMTASEAKALANRVMFYAWNSRMSFQFRLAPKYFKMEPGDVGTVTSKGILYTMKAVEVTYNNDFSIGVRGTSFLADSAIVVTGYGGTGYPQVVQQTSGAQVFIIDTPLIRESDDLSYAGAFPLYLQISPLIPTTNWPGGTAVYSPGGIEYSVMASNIQEGLAMSVISQPTVPDSVLQADTEGTITVVVRAGDATLLATVTDAEISAGANLCAYGAEGRWELIQFRDVTDNGNNSYTLSHIYRARRGTDYAVDSHVPGDYLVLLSLDHTSVTGFTHSELELSFSYKAVGFGQNQALVPAYRTTLHGYGALPWVPTIPTIDRSRTALTGDLTIRWNRRHRVSGVLADGGEYVPLGTTEQDHIYKVTIRRWPYTRYFWDGTEWSTSATDSTTDVEFIVQGQFTDEIVPKPIDDLVLVLTAAEIRTAQLYEYGVPNDFFNENTTYTQVSSVLIGTNSADNEQIRDMGYGEFVAFKWLDIMIQQKTTLATESGYGPGRMVRVLIRDL